jgi:hypothetical protein
MDVAQTMNVRGERTSATAIPSPGLTYAAEPVQVERKSLRIGGAVKGTKSGYVARRDSTLARWATAKPPPRSTR